MIGRLIYSTKLTGEINVPQLDDYACLALKIASVCSLPTVISGIKLCDGLDEIKDTTERMGGSVSLRSGKIKVVPVKDKEAAFLAFFDDDLNMLEACMNRSEGDSEEETGESVPLFRDGDYFFRGRVDDKALIALIIGTVFYSNKANIMLSFPPGNTEYIDLSLSLIRSFGGFVETNDYLTYTCSGIRKLIGGETVPLEGDWNIAAFGLMCGALGYQVTLKNANGSFSVQNGAKILQPLKRMGYVLEKSIDGRMRMTTPAETFPTQIDAEECAEFLPYMILMGSLCGGRTEIFNISDSLSKNVSDRIVSTVEEFTKLGVEFTSPADGAFQIVGRGNFEGGTKLDCHNDFIIATTLILATLRCKKSNTLLNCEILEDIYPDFWRIYEEIGGFSEEIG